MSVKVLKFGGSSVADAAQIKKMRSIVEADPERRYVVVSAPGKRYSGDSKITDLLIMLKAVIDNNIPYEPLMAPIKERYMTIANDLGIDVDLDGEFSVIRKNIENGCSGNYIVSRGEYLSARLVSAYLGYDFIDTESLVLFDNKGRLLVEETNNALAAALKQHERAVLPGFYGSYEARSTDESVVKLSGDRIKFVGTGSASVVYTAYNGAQKYLNLEVLPAPK